MAEGLLRHYLQQSELCDRVVVCSAGTKTFQPGCRPDQRAQKVAAYRGINLGQIKARRVTKSDLVRSDMIFAMDEPTMRDL
ncbi:MAG TPA: low molecular weight phosphotyrosine protein phosphatase, partial [Halioglobus sp.]